MSDLMNVMLFGVAFFGFMVIVGIVKARRRKEKAYYISAMVSFLMLISSIFVILNQFILVGVLLVTAGILSIAGLPKTIEVFRREMLKDLQETDLSAPLRGRDLLTWKGWFKLVSRWGISKTVYLYSLVAGAIFFTLTIFGMISIASATGYTIFAIFFYCLIGKALEKKKDE